ncbi:hypothetical protein ElyMa_006290300 [Elysia marginata]|uniref:Uncharacterized protein n=1 Tax=Elysia marginata TaxID=1093978 RepID=A0AAV4HD21_9GAST|nr:hypothetical protein ElyMa_006290300 [Elysia marginata]
MWPRDWWIKRQSGNDQTGASLQDTPRCSQVKVDKMFHENFPFKQRDVVEINGYLKNVPVPTSRIRQQCHSNRPSTPQMINSRCLASTEISGDPTSSSLQSRLQSV